MLDHDGVLPLHALCLSQPLLDAVKYLVDSYPASLTTQIHNGDLPFMVACEESVSLNVINYLLGRAPHLFRSQITMPIQFYIEEDLSVYQTLA